MGEDGVLYPNLFAPTEDEPHYGKYGNLRITYIRGNGATLHISMLLSDKLNAPLNELDAAANDKMELLTKQMA